MEATIYHNSRCSKSRATLGLLEEHGVSVQTINYLETPPTKDELDSLLKMLNKNPEEIIRFGESVVKDLGFTKADSRSRDEWIALMVNHPILIERPIVVINGCAVLGRPPENVLDLLD